LNALDIGFLKAIFLIGVIGWLAKVDSANVHGCLIMFVVFFERIKEAPDAHEFEVDNLLFSLFAC